MNTAIKLKSLDNQRISKIKIRRFKELSQSEISKALIALKKAFPMYKDFHLDQEKHSGTIPKLGLLAQIFKDPTKEQIDNYQNKLYPDWISNISNWLETIHIFLNVQNNRYKIVFELENKGTTFAEDLKLDLWIDDGCKMINSPKESVEYNYIPTITNCPDYPKHGIMQSQYVHENRMLANDLSCPTFVQKTISYSVDTTKVNEGRLLSS